MASGAHRTSSLTGSSRLSLSVGKNSQNAAPNGSGRHPLRHEWSLSYVHRPPGTKVEYEKEIRRVATFGSIESFLQLYSHITPPNEMPAVTDLLVFMGRIGRPGVWEEMRDGGKFTLRLLHPITPVLYESLLFALIGDQFDESDCVVGCVLSVRQSEDILSVWVEEEGESVRNGSLKEKILSLLNLPPNSLCEYRSNRALLDAASKPYPGNPALTSHNSHSNHHNYNNHSDQHEERHEHRGYNGHRHQREPREPREPRDREPREPREPRELREPREPREPREREVRDGGYAGRRENGWGHSRRD